MSSAEPYGVLDTPEGEIALLSAIIHTRPVGMGKHWAMIGILRAIEEKLGEGKVTSQEIWEKLGTLYDLRMLDDDAADMQAFAEADAELLESTNSVADTLTAGLPPRKRTRRSSVHDKPLFDKPEFNLLDKASFQEEFEKRRRRSSPSPGASTGPYNSLTLDSPSDDETAGKGQHNEAKPRNKKTPKHEESEQDDAATQSDRPSPSPPRRGRKKRSGPQSGRGSGRRKSPRKGANDDDDDDGRSDVASTLSALSEGEDRDQNGEEDSAEQDGDDGAQDEEASNANAGAEEDDQETESGSDPEDTPYKSPKKRGPRKSHTSPSPSLPKRNGTGAGRGTDSKKRGSAGPSKGTDKEPADGPTKRLSGAAAVSARKKQEAAGRRK